MPYDNVPEELWDKMDDCVDKVMEQGKDKESAIAICHANLVEGKALPVGIVFDPEAVKIGARNASEDRKRIRGIRQKATEIHNLTKELEPEDEDPPPPPPPEVIEIPFPEKALVWYGDAVKALGNGRVGGYLIRYSTDNDPDMTGEYFAPDTQFGLHKHTPVYYNHGLDNRLKARTIGDGELKLDDVGVWIEAQLNLRDEYEKAIYRMTEQGKMGWSSGTASHLVERESVGKAVKIKSWPLGLDASLTPTPAEPRNAAIPIKSVQVIPLELPEAESSKGEQPSDNAAHVTVTPEPQFKSNTTEVITMSDNVTQTTVDVEAIAKQAAEAAIKAYEAALPPINKKPEVNVVTDEADKPFVTLAEQCRAVKSFTLSHGKSYDPRLGRLDSIKATGASEDQPYLGGFLLEPTLVSELMKPIHDVAPFSSRARRLPVGSNSNFGWINGVDETSRATGSRWGGVYGYRIAEGSTPTASKPTFRRINWELRKYAALVYATDELLADASQFQAVVMQGCSEELAFLFNDDILNGVGAYGALGILNAGCLVTVSKETGQAADTLVSENISKMWSRLDPRSKANAVWFINTDVNPQLDGLFVTAGTAGLAPHVVSYAPDGAVRLKGRPIVETEYNATIGDVGDIILADMSQYLIWEKQGIQAASSIHVQFVTDEMVFRFIYRADGQPALAAPLTPFKTPTTALTVGPFVALEAR